MKDAKIIIDRHFYKNPLFEEVSKAKECKEFLSLLSLTWQKQICRCCIKEKILYFIVKHPLALQELKHDSNIFTIKKILKTFVQVKESVAFKDILDIKFIVARQLKFQNLDEIDGRKYILRKVVSKGDFKNLAKSPEIFEKFEEIRKILKEKSAD